MTVATSKCMRAEVRSLAENKNASQTEKTTLVIGATSVVIEIDVHCTEKLMKDYQKLILGLNRKIRALPANY